MRKTLEECKKLRCKFIEWAELQEPRYFSLIIGFNLKIDETIKNYDKVPDKELDSMFAVINNVMKPDA